MNIVDVKSELPTLLAPVSQACTQAQFDEPSYEYWCQAIREVPRYHRKQWEFCFILQALAVNDMLRPGARGLGFGVGREPLPALMASRGISVLATDLETSSAVEAGWVSTLQHAPTREALNDRGICSPDEFSQLVDTRFMNMTAIDPNLDNFDFCWSACALEHLGSIERGLTFIEQALSCLRPGGIAVHTTEYNCSSDEDTLDNSSTVLFRRRDIMGLAERLQGLGHSLVLNFTLGDGPVDRHVDVPPYSSDHHLKLLVGGFATTSFGLIIRRAD